MNLEITILIHDVPDLAPAAEQAMARSVVEDVLDWVHSDISGLGGDPGALVTAKLTQRCPASLSDVKVYRRNYSDSGEDLEEV